MTASASPASPPSSSPATIASKRLSLVTSSTTSPLGPAFSPLGATSSTFPEEEVSSPTEERASSSSAFSGGGGKGYEPVEALEGDLGGEFIEESEVERERRRRVKGKGKARVESDGKKRRKEMVVEEEGFDPREVMEEEEEDQEEVERREEARIAENLAAWSRAESTRRAAVRKTSTLVLPSAPPLPSATTLARRSSALIRAGSKRLSRTNLPSEDIPLRDSSELVDHGIEPESRRALRKGSVRLNDREESRNRGEGMDKVVEEEEDRPVTPTSTKPFNNPLVPTLSTSSRFLEDLPPQSPTRPTTTQPHQAKPTRLSLDTNASPEEDLTPSPTDSSNPFSDGFELHNTPGAKMNGNKSRGGGFGVSTDSVDTIRAGGTTGRERESEEVREYEGRGYVGREAYLASGRRRQQQEEEEVDDVGGVGWLDWLLCGCFRAGEGREGEEQAGRTNPNE